MADIDIMIVQAATIALTNEWFSLVGALKPGGRIGVAKVYSSYATDDGETLRQSFRNRGRGASGAAVHTEAMEMSGITQQIRY
jgi:hypothetical protein